MDIAGLQVQISGRRREYMIFVRSGMRLRTQLLALAIALPACIATAQTSPPPNSELPHERTLNNDPCENEGRLGISSSRGRSSFLDFSGGAKACTDRGRRRIAAEAEVLSSSRNGSNTIMEFANAEFEYRFQRSWFWILYANQEAERDLGLQSRVVAAPGIGYQDSPEWGFFLVETGITRTWQNELGASPTAFPEYWSASEVRWVMSQAVQFTQSVEFYAKTGNTADHRWLANSMFRFRVSDRLSIRSSLRFQWDNVPASNYPKTGVSTRTEIVYTFRR